MLRGASLECPVCGEFVLHEGAVGALSRVRDDAVRAQRFCVCAGRIGLAGRVTAGLPRLEESPDTAGQDAPVREAAKADGQWHRKQTADGVFSGDAAGKGETVG